jgi:hypothetical protein
MEPLRFSSLKLFAQSAAHYRWSLDHGEQFTQSPAMRLGSAVHALLLGGDLVVYDSDRRGKAWAEFRESYPPDSLILTASEHAEAKHMAASVEAHPLAGPLLTERATVHERRIDWMRDGRACRGTPDAVGGGALVELKTTRSAEPEKFIRDATRMGYHGQLSFYASGLLAAGTEVRDLYIIAVESAPPYATTLLELEPTAWAAGDALVATWWEQLRACERSGVWPRGYTDACVKFGIEGGAMSLSIDGNDFDF